MAEPEIRLTYDGGDATRHAIDMRLLGQSLQGIDRIISDGIIIFLTERLPKRGERAGVIIKIKEPVAGSYDIYGMWQEVAGLLPLGLPILNEVGTDIVSNWVKYVLSFFQGKEDIAKKALDTLVTLRAADIAANDRADERRHLEAMGMQELLREAMLRLGPAATMYAAPVGKSVDSATFRSGSHLPIVLDSDGAEQIRRTNEIEWASLGEMTLRTEGFKFHTSGLSVEHPDREGFLMARVSDPVFEQEMNPYTEAAQRKATILVLARRGYRNGLLEQIDIVDFIRETGT